MADFFDQIKRLWGELGTSQRVSLSIAVMGIVGVIAGLMIWASRPKLQLLYGGLDPKEMGEVVKTVESLGIPYEVRGGGASIFVDGTQVHSVRMKLAADGLPKGGGVGFEIFDSGSFGISTFVQHTNYVRAIQGELSRTINELDSVRSSKVMIVMPENELLINGPRRKPTASVFVDTGGRTLDLAQVDAIRSLVSSAVESLNPNDVSVVDNRGNVLSAGLQDDGLMGAGSSQVKFRKGLEDYFTHKAESMLAKVVGPENVVVRVSVGLDLDLQTLFEEQFDPEAQVVRKENSTENTTVRSETSRAGIAGEESNTGGGTVSNSQPNLANTTNETRKERDTSYEINRKTIETVRNPGTIKTLNASVVLALPFVDNGQGVLTPQPRGAEELSRIRMMVVNALGIQYADEAELNKRVSIEEIEFRSTTQMGGSASGASVLEQLPFITDLVRNSIGVILSVVMLLFFFRMIRQSARSSERMEVLAAEAESAQAAAKENHPMISAELLNELIKQNPDKVSSALKNWAFPDQ
jgi:flagellar M-ring protein FliF